MDIPFLAVLPVAGWIDALAICFVTARMIQTLVHIGFTETNLTVGIRFSFFFVQFAVMLAFASAIVLAHL